MAESHDIHLRVDASGAKRGASEFKGALASVRKAVEDLDRDTNGLFTKLKAPAPTRNPQAGLTQIAKASRTAEQELNALHRRLTRVGDVRGIETATRAHERFHQELQDSVRTTGDLRAAQDRLKGALFPIQESAKQAAEMERLEAAYGRVVAQIDDAGPAQLAYRRGAQATERMHNAGAISAEEYRQTLDRLESQYLSVGNSAVSAEARQRRFLGSMAGWHGHGGMARQLGLQINQIGQVAGMATSAEQALKGASYQAADIGLVFGGVGTAIGTVAGVALPMLIDRLYAAENRGKALSEATKTLESSLNAYKSATSLARSSTTDLRAEFGSLTASVRENIAALQEHAMVQVQTDLSASARAATDAYSDAFDALNRLDQAAQIYDSGARPLLQLESLARQSLKTLGLTTDQARDLRGALSGLSRVDGGPEEMRRAFSDVLGTLNRLYPSVEAMPTPIRALHRHLLDSDVAAAKLLATEEGTVTAGNNSANAASNLSAELGTAAGAAAQLLANLGSVPAALSTLQGSVEDQIAGIKAQNRSLEIQLSEGMSSAAANRRVQLEDMVDAAKSGGNVNLDQIANAAKEIEQLETAAQRQEALRKRLAEANKPDKSGGSSGSAKKISEEARAIQQLNSRIEDRLMSLRDTATAQELVNRGLYESTKAAELHARKVRVSGQALDEQTRKMLRQIDVMTTLQEQAKNDPVQRYIDNLPSLADAKRQVQADLLTATENGLTDALMGEIDPAKILKGIQRSIARGMAQSIMQSIAPGLSTGLGGSVVRGSQTGAALMQQAVAAGGMQAASSIRAASTGAAIPTPGTGSGGGFLGNMGQMALSVFGFSEGGVSQGTSPHPMTMPLSAFANAPRYAEGTPNTSEIPAVLHPNEAVVPLSRGRKIPVEMSGQAQSGPTFNGDFVTQVNVEGGGEGDAELAQRIGGAVRENIESMIDLKIAESAQYGGALNPRGRF